MVITVSISGKELKVEVDTGFSSLQSLPEEDAKSLELQTEEMEEPEIYSTQSGPQELTLAVKGRGEGGRRTDDDGKQRVGSLEVSLHSFFSFKINVFCFISLAR